MVGGLRRDDALGFAGAETRAMAREALGDAIAHEGSGGRTTRRNAHPAADGGAAQQGNAVMWQAAQRPEDFLPIDPRRYRAGLELLLDRNQQLADAEQPHDGNDEADALRQFVYTHGEPHAAR